MAQEFKMLMSQFKLGPLTLRNRIVFLPHLPSITAYNHVAGDREAYYYAERARGGAALCIWGAQAVAPEGSFGWDPIASKKENIAAYKKASQMVHEYGGLIFNQLAHWGNQALSRTSLLDLDDWLPIVGPSDIPDEVVGVNPQPLDKEGIRRIIDHYRMAASNTRDGGMDGIELKFAHDGLARQFLSPYSNRRTDEYGGSIENRMRFALEVIDAVRAEVGNDYVVGIRLCMDELIPGGYTLDDAKEFAKRFAATGKINYISNDLGLLGISLFAAAPPMVVPPGFTDYSAAALKEIQDLPVIHYGRLCDPVVAERVLQEGHADLIGMARGLLADPYLPQKIKEGRVDEVNRCMACNQGCLLRLWLGRDVSCIQNPASGREQLLAPWTAKPAETRKKVMVIGGGPAGMKAASVAAERGHDVVLYEKGDQLGGQVNTITKMPVREDMVEVPRYLGVMLKKYGVKVNLNSEATVETVDKEKPDVVILATGSRPRVLEGVEVTNGGRVLNCVDVLEGRVQVGNKVVVYDCEGFWRSVGTVDWLLQQDKEVEVVTPMPFFGTNIDRVCWTPVFQRLYSKTLKVTPFTVITEISGNTVTTKHVYGEQENKIENVDAVIAVAGGKANDEMYEALKGKAKELYRIGDCASPRDVEAALFEGLKVGREI